MRKQTVLVFQTQYSDERRRFNTNNLAFIIQSGDSLLLKYEIRHTEQTRLKPRRTFEVAPKMGKLYI